jgi:predicted NBD/HSP70 family sugar kinase
MYASGSAIIDKVRAVLEQGATSSLAEFAEHDQKELSLEDIALAAESHDRVCARVLREAGAHFGAALANLVNLLNPQRIILGGTLPRVTKNLLLEPLRGALWNLALPRSVTELEVIVSELGEDAVALGISLLASKRIFDNLCTLIQTKRGTFDATRVCHEALSTQ